MSGGVPINGGKSRNVGVSSFIQLIRLAQCQGISNNGKSARLAYLKQKGQWLGDDAICAIVSARSVSVNWRLIGEL